MHGMADPPIEPNKNGQEDFPIGQCMRTYTGCWSPRFSLGSLRGIRNELRLIGCKWVLKASDDHF
jgi:hypothetical protein